MTPKTRAERAAQAMWDGDQASKWAGMEITHIDEATATLEMTVEAHHCNGHGTCHGGVTFMLAHFEA